ncbi:DUF2254 domain-containing protein [Natronobacterium texcoconense]|uniref:DUF2254 domain-containing protein n=1 Tax=Natronobacterium texcoconense TaxID=1095778 RepID=A0A1H1FZ18_NATTX|nr:hypothetical protein [Natronobacterium texcoconense]SDR05878.1 hypothetical protein SAMN04489842_2168 [Natronobacterium texcoconense]
MTGWNERIGEISPIFGIGAALLALVSLVGWKVAKYNGPIISANAPGTLADVLFTSQASVVAIVFSLTYVGVQLTSPQYSPRLTWLFTENRHLQLTLIVVGISLFINAVVLVVSDLVPPTLRLATAASMIVLAGVSFAAVAEYAIRSLTLATPSGVIAAYKTRITTDKYLSEIRNTRESRRIDENPLRGFHEFLCSQIDDGSNSTWSNGVEVMTTKAEEITRSVLDTKLGKPSSTQTIDRTQTANLPLIREVDTTQASDVREDDVVECNNELVELPDETNLSGESLFRPLLVEFIPELACKAHESDEEDAALMCLKQLRVTHEHGLEYGSKEVVQLCHEGFRTILTDDPETSVSAELALMSWYFALVELRETAKIESKDHYRFLATEIEFYRDLLENERRAEFYADYSVFEGAFTTTNRILSIAIDSGDDNLNAEIRDLWNLDLDSYSARTALIIATFRLLCSLTELAVMDTGEQNMYVSPDTLHRAWSSVAQAASRLDAVPAVPFYRGLIEAGFVISVRTDGDRSTDQVKRWQKTITRVHNDSPAAVEEAFKQVYPQKGTGRRRTATLPQPLLRLAEFKPIREHKDADRILPELDPTAQPQDPQHTR